MLNDHQPGSELNGHLAAALQTYQALEQKLSRQLAASFVDVDFAVGALLDACDEFGVEHATEILTERPGAFGQQTDTPMVLVAIAVTLDQAVQAHDALDKLMLQQSPVNTQEASGTRRFFIHGHDHTLDAARQIAWPTAEPERFFAFTTIERADVAPELRRLAARQRDLDKIKRLKSRDLDRDR
jgi:hypothetical protein